jgi:hypothetical protein
MPTSGRSCQLAPTAKSWGEVIVTTSQRYPRSVDPTPAAGGNVLRFDEGDLVATRVVLGERALRVVGHGRLSTSNVKGRHADLVSTAGFSRTPLVGGHGSRSSAGRRPRSKGRRYPPDPRCTEEIIAVMRCCGDGLHGDRARGLIVVLWRAGLRIQE